MPKITTFLTFESRALEAAKYYVSVFKKNSRVGKVTRYPEGAPMPKGSVMTVTFLLDGQEFVALNGGPYFQFTEAVSLSVDANSQKEIDAYTKKLAAGGKQKQCGWVEDKFGVSWQVNPTILIEMMSGPDPRKSQRVMQAMMKMKKLDIATLKKAYAGR